MQDYNSIVAASLMHFLTFWFVYLRYYFGAYDEMIDLKSLDESNDYYNLR